MQIICIVSILLFLSNFATQGNAKQPNIIVIMADDAGWNDFSFHGADQIPTPNIDALAYHGTILNRFYTQQSCTPSRSAFLTGNYPIRYRFQGMPIDAGEDRYLPKNMTTMAESFRSLGYKTHLIGKWHVGGSKKEYSPNERGFDTFFGFHSGWMGYFDHRLKTPPGPCNFPNVPPSFGSPENFPCLNGYALYDNFRPAYEYNGKYATTIFTDKATEIIKQSKKNPFFMFISHLAPHVGKDGNDLEVLNDQENNQKFSYINDTDRRQYAGLMNEIDRSVGKIMTALQNENLLKNSIVVFLSDNGPQTEGIYRNKGSPWPFRGLKFTAYEGAIRGTAVVYSPLIKRKRKVNNQLMHITDLYPSLYSAAGGKVSKLRKLDRLDQWQTIRNMKTSARSELLVNADETLKLSAIIGHNGQYKLVNGTYLGGLFDKYFGDTGRENSPPYNIEKVLQSEANVAIEKAEPFSGKLNSANILQIREQLDVSKLVNEDKRKAGNDFVCQGFCLFDLFKDPFETTDISSQNGKVVDELKNKLLKYWNELVPQPEKLISIESDPKQCNDTWFFWKDEPPFCPVQLIHTK